jgi:excisionase family DNA binding protein
VSTACPKPERISTRDAALICGLSQRKLQQLCQQGEIPGAARLGGKYTLDEALLRAWIAANVTTRPPPAALARIHPPSGRKADLPRHDDAYARAIGLNRNRL